MTIEFNRQDLAEIACQLEAYGRYFQAAGLEEAGKPVSTDRNAGETNVRRWGATGGEAHLPPSELAAFRTRAEQTTDPAVELKVIRDDLGECTRCRLHDGRTHIVFGTGNPRARLMFVGEAPGQDEDEQGLPFVGRAGQLLTKMIESMGYKRDDVYIANVLKCRPPGNRPPKPDEVATCGPFLRKQIAAINPDVLCTLGSFAAQAVLRREDKISAMRGKFFLIDGVTVLPTYHPAYLLRNPSEKRTVWEDLQKIMAVLRKVEKQ
jgi:uracil-DNA glycosylase family 4